MHLVIPGHPDRYGPRGETTTAYAWVDYLGVGPNDPDGASGRVAIACWRSIEAAYQGGEPFDRIEFRAGAGLPSIPELQQDPRFRLGWLLIGVSLLDAIAAARGGTVVLSPEEGAILASIAASAAGGAPS